MERSQSRCDKTVHGRTCTIHTPSSRVEVMDGLASLLDGPRARGAFLLRVLLDAPWSVRLRDEAPLSVTAVVRGHLWVCPDDEEPVLVEAGDVVVWVGSAHGTIADAPATEPQVVILPGQACTTMDGHHVEE